MAIKNSAWAREDGSPKGMEMEKKTVIEEEKNGDKEDNNWDT